MNRILLTILSVILSATNILSQTHITGIVTDNGSPVVGAAVFIENTTNGCATDANGHFDIEYKGRFPVNIVTQIIGFETLTTEVGADKTTDITISLSAESQNLEGVNVVGEKRNTGFEKIDTESAQKITGVSGGIENVLTTQMGVSTNSELSTQYRVRGGNFDENMIYVNGIEIYRPFLIRSGEQEGLSFVNPDMVEALQFSSGGFDASYGDRMSSVLDVTYKKPTTNAGSLRASLLGGSVHFEGATANSRFTHISGIRYKTNRYVFKSLDTSGDYDPTFLDAQTFITIAATDKLTFDVLGYYAGNKYKFRPKDRETSFGTINDARKLKIYFEGKENDNYQTGIAAATASYRINNENIVRLTASMYRSSEQENYDILGEYWLQQAEAASTLEAYNESEGIGVGGYMQHARNELYARVNNIAVGGTDRIGRHALRWEIKYQTEHFDNHTDEWQFRDSAGVTTRTPGKVIDFDYAAYGLSKTRTNRTSVYLTDNYSFRKNNTTFTFDYGLRVAHQTRNGETLVSPRAAVRINRDKVAYRLAAGIYNQSPFFREMQRADGTMNEEVGAQKSWQVVGGFDYFFEADSRPFKFTAEAYYKGLSDLNPYNIDNVRIRYMGDNCASGYAAGLDVKINGELVEGIESWACLSVMRTEEDVDNDGAGNIPRPSDQRVSFSTFLQDYLPNNRSVGASLSMFLSTGLPFGPPNCERRQATNRMPGYKRIDLGLYKDFAKAKDGTCKMRGIKSLQIGVDVFNLFDFSNTISYFWVKGTGDKQYAVPNYLTSRRINIKFSLEF